MRREAAERGAWTGEAAEHGAMTGEAAERAVSEPARRLRDWDADTYHRVADAQESWGREVLERME
ncbi:MAG TPA: hypothetical protein VGY97_12565, partial [Solirubrobacteraceae bacterium]|nr:hypothetical protein [Solirubrobacteraceae bacterium]